MNPKLRNIAGPLLATLAGYLSMRYVIDPYFAASKAKSNSAVVAAQTAAAANNSARAREPVLTLPEFSLKNRNDQLQSIRSWPGQSLIINFWATWCEPCRREMPLLMKLQQERAVDGFQVVGIAVDFRDAVIKYADAMKIAYPLLIGEQDGLTAIDAFGIEQAGFPFTVFTDNNGDIIVTHLGELHPADTAIILTAVQRVNRGELAVEAARTQIAAALLNTVK